MTANELRSLIGDTIPFNYTIDNVEYSGSFVYASSMDFQYASSILGYNVSDNPVFGSTKLPNYEGLFYYWISDFSSATSLYNVDIKLNMTFSGGARGGFMAGGLGSASPSNMTTALNAISNGGNYIGGVGSASIITGNTQADASLADYYGIVSTTTSNYSPGDTFRPLVYDSSDFSINHVFYNRIRTYNMNSINRQILSLYVIAPYKYGNVSASTVDTTTSTTGTTSSDINVNVTVDNTETNGLLGDIKSLISNIGSTIINALRSVFVPSDDFMDEFKEFFLGDGEDPGFLEDHLGGLYEAIELIDNFIESLLDIEPHSSFHVPAASIPLAGTDFPVGNWDLSVESDAIPQIAYDGLKWLLDFLATAAFLNMCKYKLEIFLNPDTEVVKEE